MQRRPFRSPGLEDIYVQTVAEVTAVESRKGSSPKNTSPSSPASSPSLSPSHSVSSRSEAAPQGASVPARPLAANASTGVSPGGTGGVSRHQQRHRRNYSRDHLSAPSGLSPHPPSSSSTSSYSRSHRPRTPLSPFSAAVAAVSSSGSPSSSVKYSSSTNPATTSNNKFSDSSCGTRRASIRSVSSENLDVTHLDPDVETDPARTANSRSSSNANGGERNENDVWDNRTSTSQEADRGTERRSSVYMKRMGLSSVAPGKSDKKLISRSSSAHVLVQTKTRDEGKSRLRQGSASAAIESGVQRRKRSSMSYARPTVASCAMRSNSSSPSASYRATRRNREGLGVDNSVDRNADTSSFASTRSGKTPGSSSKTAPRNGSPSYSTSPVSSSTSASRAKGPTLISISQLEQHLRVANQQRHFVLPKREREDSDADKGLWGDDFDLESEDFDKEVQDESANNSIAPEEPLSSNRAPIGNPSGALPTDHAEVHGELAEVAEDVESVMLWQEDEDEAANWDVVFPGQSAVEKVGVMLKKGEGVRKWEEDEEEDDDWGATLEVDTDEPLGQLLEKLQNNRGLNFSQLTAAAVRAGPEILGSHDKDLLRTHSGTLITPDDLKRDLASLEAEVVFDEEKKVWKTPQVDMSGFDFSDEEDDSDSAKKTGADSESESDTHSDSSTLSSRSRDKSNYLGSESESDAISDGGRSGKPREPTSEKTEMIEAGVDLKTRFSPAKRTSSANTRGVRYPARMRKRFSSAEDFVLSSEIKSSFAKSAEEHNRLFRRFHGPAACDEMQESMSSDSLKPSRDYNLTLQQLRQFTVQRLVQDARKLTKMEKYLDAKQRALEEAQDEIRRLREILRAKPADSSV